MLNMFCETKVISYIKNEKNITKTFLESEELILESLTQIKNTRIN